MNSTTRPVGSEQIPGDSGAFDTVEEASVLRELEAILSSPPFQTSKRCQQFLSYVVRHQLTGNRERLKERTIGVDLFQRPVGYSTGDDPVVRVQAGEVRRRLEQYYHATTHQSPVRIELHVGSYSPEFRWAQDVLPIPALSQAEREPTQQRDAPQAAAHTQEQLTVALPAMAEIETKAAKRRPFSWVVPMACLVLIIVLAAIGIAGYRGGAPKSASTSTFEEFWAPALGSSEPVLICLAKPTVYVPAARLYHLHSKNPSVFNAPPELLMREPDLQPNDQIKWGDMVEIPDWGVATGDVYAAVQLSVALGRMSKKNHVRIGGNYSFEDLRNSPAVVVGAFNNRWTMQMTSNLHFAFVERDGQLPVGHIQEEGKSGRELYPKYGLNGAATEDYAVVTRLLNSKTGQFVVAIGGILSYGTQAAGELVSNAESLEKALQSAPPDWRKRNLQILVHTTVTDGVSGPPQVVAVYVW